MKLHDFIASQHVPEKSALRELGQKLVTPVVEAKKPLKPAKVTSKTVDMDGDGDVDGMDAAIMIMAQDDKVTSRKIKHHD